MEKIKGFRITDGKGFQMRFENGWGISVQFGIGNYCENSRIDWGVDSNRKCGEEGSNTAEIAIFCPDGEFFEHEEYANSDCVCGHLPPDRVAYFIAWASAQPPAGSP